MPSAFSQTFSGKLTFDATSGEPTGITGVVKESLVGGTLKGVTSIITGDEVVVGLGRTLATGLVAYGSANFARKKVTGAFALNPFGAVQ
jgi:hypothetical protein